MDARTLPDDLDLAAVLAALPSPTALFTADDHLTVLAVSDALLAAAQHGRDRVIGRPLLEALSSASHQALAATGLAELRASLLAAVATGAPQHMPRQRYDLQRPNGEWEVRYWDAVNVPVRGADGSVRYVLHQATEVTAQVLAEAAATSAAVGQARAEAELRQTDAWLQLATEAAELALFEWDLGTDTVSANEQFRRLFRLPVDGELRAAELLRRRLHPEDVALVEAELQRAMHPASSGRYAVEHRLAEPDRHGERWVLASGRVYFEGEDSQRRPVRVLGTTLNTSERKRTEVALRESETKYRTAEERQRYLLELSEALRPLSDPLEVQRAATRALGEHLRADRVFYSETGSDGKTIVTRDNYVRGRVQKFVGEVDATTFGDAAERLKNGGTVVLHDVQTDAFTEAERAAYVGVDMVAGVAVPLVKGGVWVATLVVHSKTKRAWTAAEITLVEETAARTWAAVERARAEGALRESEERYRELFERIDEGYCIIEMIFHGERPVDYRFLEVNSTFEGHTGIANAAGRRMREIAPDHEQHWFDFYGEIARTGQAKRHEAQARALGDRWFEVKAFRIGEPEQRRVAVVFRDITERTRRESITALLDAIGRDLSRLTAPDQLMQTVGARLGEFLQASACLFADVDEVEHEATIQDGWKTDDAPGLPPSLRLSDFLGEELAGAVRAGETVIVRDSGRDPRTNAEACARLELGAFVTVPFQRQGRWIASVTVTSRAPRDWRTDEIELLREIASRTFPRVERARAEAALRASEQRLAADLVGMRRLHNLHSRLANETDRDAALHEILAAACDFTGTDRGYVQLVSRDGLRLEMLAERGFDPSSPFIDHFRDRGALLPRDNTRRHQQRLIIEDIEASKPLAGAEARRVARADGIRALQSTPMVTRSGEMVGVLSTQFGKPHRPAEHELRLLDLLAWTAAEFVERHRVDQALREVSERQAFLLELSDNLRSLTDPEEVQAHTCRALGTHLAVDRAYYVEVDETAGRARVRSAYARSDAPSLVGEHRLADFGWAIPPMRDGKVLVIQDVNGSALVPDSDRPALAAVGVGAHVNVPLVKNGALIGALCVTEPGARAWSSAEVELVRETAERVWAAAERARAEQALRESERQLREANRAKDEFLAMLGHELRNPLAPIVSTLELLRVSGGRKFQKEREMMLLQARHLAALLDDLLDVSRLARGKIELHPSTVALDQLVARAVEASGPLIEQRRHSLTVNVASRLMLSADEKRMVQVISNLLNNAAHYTPPGGHLEVIGERDDRAIVLRVRDSGVGIAPELLPRVFERFQQGPRSHDRSEGGLGLGLAIVRSFLELHGGTVTASSDGVGKGSEFTLRLPASSAPPVSTLPPRSEKRAVARAAGHRILLVDDNRAIADVLALLLAKTGNLVEKAYDAPTALSVASIFRPTIAILDIGLPEMSGYELAKQLRKLRGLAELRMIALTGYGSRADRQRSKRAGFAEHLSKPVEFDDLVATIVRVSATSTRRKPPRAPRARAKRGRSAKSLENPS